MKIIIESRKNAKNISFEKFREKWDENFRKNFMKIEETGEVRSMDGTIVSNTLLIPIIERQYLDSNGEIFSTEIEFLIICNKRNITKHITCNINEIDKQLIRKTKEVVGLEMKISDNRGLLKQFINATTINNEHLQKETILNRTGWIFHEGEFFYFDGEKKIGHNLSYGKKLLIQNNQDSYSIAFDHLDKKAIRRYMDELFKIAPYDLMLPLLTHTILSVLNTPLKEKNIEPKFILWIYGETGSRKTSICKLFANTSRGNSNNVLCSFKDTKSRIEYKMSKTSDSILLIDDYHPPKNASERDQLKETSEMILRFIGDRISKGRMTATMEPMENTNTNGNVIVTGEDLLEGHSSLARCYPVRLYKKEVCLDSLSYCQKNIIVLSSIIKEFIEWFSKDYQNYQDEMSKKFNEYRAKFLFQGAHGRTTDNVALLSTGFYIFRRYINDNEIFSNDELSVLKKKFTRIMEQHLVDMSKLLAHQNPVDLYLNALIDMIDSGTVKLKLAKDTENGKSFHGFEDSEFYYLRQSSIATEIVRYYQLQRISFPVSMEAVYGELAQLGILKTEKRDKGVNYTIKKRIDGSVRFRYMILDKSKVVDYLESKSNETEIASSNRIKVSSKVNLKSLYGFQALNNQKDTMKAGL